MSNASFADMAVALICSRTRLERDLIRLRQLTASISLSDMGTMLALEGFKQDLSAIEQCGVLLREMSRYENDVLALIERKNRQRPVDRLISWASQATAG